MAETIILLGRTEEHLGEDERRRLARQYGDELEFVTTRPGTSEEHLADCERLRPAAVLLPSDEPLFAKAVKRGVEHVVYASGRNGWGLFVLWNLKGYPFRSFFKSFPSSLAYFNDRPK